MCNLLTACCLAILNVCLHLTAQDLIAETHQQSSSQNGQIEILIANLKSTYNTCSLLEDGYNNEQDIEVQQGISVQRINMMKRKTYAARIIIDLYTNMSDLILHQVSQRIDGINVEECASPLKEVKSMINLLDQISQRLKSSNVLLKKGTDTLMTYLPNDTFFAATPSSKDYKFKLGISWKCEYDMKNQIDILQRQYDANLLMISTNYTESIGDPVVKDHQGNVDKHGPQDHNVERRIDSINGRIATENATCQDRLLVSILPKIDELKMKCMEEILTARLTSHTHALAESHFLNSSHSVVPIKQFSAILENLTKLAKIRKLLLQCKNATAAKELQVYNRFASSATPMSQKYEDALKSDKRIVVCMVITITNGLNVDVSVRPGCTINRPDDFEEAVIKPRNSKNLAVNGLDQPSFIVNGLSRSVALLWINYHGHHVNLIEDSQTKNLILMM